MGHRKMGNVSVCVSLCERERVNDRGEERIDGERNEGEKERGRGVERRKRRGGRGMMREKVRERRKRGDAGKRELQRGRRERVNERN